jgi:CubicO group peptidase (beta-lactamase class C family)
VLLSVWQEVWYLQAPGWQPAVPHTLAPGGTLERYVQHLADQDQFSGTILVAKGVQPVLLKAYGQANKAKKLPNRSNTIYALGSVTKSFTALAIMQLVQQGKLAVQDHLSKYLSGFPSAIAKTVTIHQLLTHTSGMGDVFHNPQFQSESATWTSGAQTMAGLLTILRQQPPLMFTPGTQWHYSNSGYDVLGEIVQQVSGQSYYDYVRQHIFQAAGMSQTDFYTRLQREQNPLIAHPYSLVGGQFVLPSRGLNGPENGSRVDVSNLVEYIGYPSGSAYSTVEDMLRYSQALQTYQLLNEASTKLLMAGKVKTPLFPKHQSDQYAYGLSDSLVNGQRIIWHNGGSGGIATEFDMYPALGWTVVILSNYDPDQSMQSLVTEEEVLATKA